MVYLNAELAVVTLRHACVLLVSGEDCTIRVWNVEDGSLIRMMYSQVRHRAGKCLHMLCIATTHPHSRCDTMGESHAARDLVKHM